MVSLAGHWKHHAPELAQCIHTWCRSSCSPSFIILWLEMHRGAKWVSEGDGWNIAELHKSTKELGREHSAWKNYVECILSLPFTRRNVRSLILPFPASLGWANSQNNRILWKQEAKNTMSLRLYQQYFIWKHILYMSTIQGSAKTLRWKGMSKRIG